MERRKNSWPETDARTNVGGRKNPAVLEGYDFDVLDCLDERGLIVNEHGRGPASISKEGERLAQELLRKYGLTE